MLAMPLQLSRFWQSYESNCLRCETEGVVRGPLGDFWHDLKCWSLKTACYNMWFRIREIWGDDDA